MKVELRVTPFTEFSRVVRFFLPALAAIAFFSYASNAQTADEVIAKNIQAHGGADKLKTVRSIRTTAKFSQGAFRADFRQENKRTDKIREEFIIQGLAQVQACDGKTEWQISPFGGRKDPELLLQDDLKSLAVDAHRDRGERCARLRAGHQGRHWQAKSTISGHGIRAAVFSGWR